MDDSALRVGMARDTDADLLGYMSMRKQDPHGAQEAWKQFHERHVEYLYKVCRRFRTVLGGEAGVCDLVQDTLLRVYDKAEKFSVDDLTDPDKIQTKVRSWMGLIAANLLRSALRSAKKMPTQFLEQQDWQDVPERETEGEVVALTSSELTLYERALNGLSANEREVLRVTGLYWRFGQKNQKLPNGVAEALAERLGTTPENVRQLRRRALRQVAEFIANETSAS